MCRALATIRNDRPCSKQEGAALIRSWLPDWAWLIDEAERCRLSRGRSGFADDRVTEAAASFVALVGDAILTIVAPAEYSSNGIHRAARADEPG
jgi:hypothetical protein